MAAVGQLSIEASDLAQLLSKLAIPIGEDLVPGVHSPSRWTTHHVAQVFLAFFPRNAVLDGSSRITVYCGEPGPNPQYVRALGTTAVYVTDFDFAAYEAATPFDRQFVALRALVQGLDVVCSKCECSVEPVLSTAKQVQDAEFRLVEEYHKLSRRLLGTKLRARVYRHISLEDGESWRLLVTLKQVAVFDCWIGNHPTYTSVSHAKSRWDGGDFLLLDPSGHVNFRLDIAQFEDIETSLPE